MVRFILVRHGFSMGNKEKKFTGQLDLPLDEVGEKQALSVKEYIISEYKPDLIFSSDLIRAYNTVKPLAENLQIDIIKSKELREVDVGEWQGVEIEKIKKKYPEEFEFYKNTPGLFDFPKGESYKKTSERAEYFLRETAEKNDGKTIVVATHGGVIRVLRALWTDTPFNIIQKIEHVPNASVTIAEYNEGNFYLKQVGYCEYLSDKTTEEGIK